MSPILLQPGIKNMLLADCKDFLCSEDWYVPCSHARVPSSAPLQTYVSMLSEVGALYFFSWLGLILTRH
jgi:hypothetical protein